MNKQLQWKFALVLGVVLASLYAIWPIDKKIKLGLDLKGGTSFKLQLDLSGIDKEGHAHARAQAVEIIRKRVDRFGVAEPIIQPEGTDRIVVQIPGLGQEKREEARRTLARTAYLEFRLVHENNEELASESVSDPRFVDPVGFKKLIREETSDGRTIKHIYFVKVRPELTGKYVTRAYPLPDDLGRPYVSLEFDPEGAAIFGRVTSANIGRQLAIILDGELESAPVIQDAITGGRAQITGSFSQTEAQQLANVLENPLEAPVKILEERGVDPSLGHDSIRSGVLASIIGALIVLVFMPVYYRLAGIVAVLALALNLLILLGVLAMFGFTLTLPGIAGIVLTIGMSVDANVLIYERIREELAANKTLRAAIAAGYKRAFLVIFDSNLTTILSAGILIWLGSGPVKGFGITLTIGLIANLLTAVFFTRLVFETLAITGWLKTFNMMHLFKPTKINFLGMRHAALIGAAVVVLAGGATFVKHGGLQLGNGRVYGVDFAGGDAVTLEFKQMQDVGRVRSVLEQAGVSDPMVQYQRDLAGGNEVLYLKLPEGAGEKAVTTLQSAFPEAALTVLATESVGAVIGKELLTEALDAVALAMVVIMVYVAFRFGEFAYGLGALVSLLLNVLMTVSIFVLMGRTFSLTVIAAILTIVGYSINDTIVVFDRIREDKKLAGGRLNYFDLINRSINETLSRTVVTGGTTILSTVALLLFGGSVLNDFAFTFLVGVLTGTFASIFIATPVVLWFHRKEGVHMNRPSAKKPQPAKA